jgi:hypothetical protein
LTPWWRQIWLLALLLLSGGAARAQVSAYTFAASAGTFTALPASATTVAAVQADDAVSAALPLGFTFSYDGSDYTQVVVSSNGFISFNIAGASSFDNALATGAAANRPLAAPLWDDMAGTDASSRASYEVTGTAGSRVFTFEWLNWKWYRFAKAPGISFQARLYEGSNVVEFVYRPEAGALTAAASIGLSGLGTGSGSFLSLNNSGTAPTASSTSETTNINTKPAAGQTYTFTPSAATCIAPRRLTVGSISGTSATLTFTGSSAAASYTVTYTPTGSTAQTMTGTSSPIVLTGLTAGTVYGVSVVANCAAGQTSSATTASFTTTAPVSYCTSVLGGGGGVAGQLISAVAITGTTLNNTSNNCLTANNSSYARRPGKRRIIPSPSARPPAARW